MSWTTDGSAELSAKGKRIECSGKGSSGHPVSAIWKDTAEGLKQGKHFWKVRCESLDGMGFFGGITDSAKFKKGPEFNGLMFGRNLSSGGGKVLQPDFGPELKTSDVLGIFVDMEGANLQVYFQVNEASLGMAFDLPKNTLNEIFPVIQFSGKGAVTIEKVTEFPNQPAMVGSKTSKASFTGIEGPWEFVTGSIGIDTTGIPATLQIAKDKENIYAGILNVVNTVQFKLTGPPKAPGTWKADMGVSTRMAGSAAAMKVETQLTDFIKGLTQVAMEGEMLSIKDKGGKNISWKRHAATAKMPVKENPFAPMGATTMAMAETGPMAKPVPTEQSLKSMQ